MSTSQDLGSRLMAAVSTALLALSTTVGAVFSGGWLDELLQLAFRWFVSTDGGQVQLARVLDEASKALQQHASTLMTAALATGGLALLAALPLLWRAAFRRRPAVFVSFHHTREALALDATEALSRAGFAVRRLPFDATADHQAVVSQMQQLQRGADALVCLPGAVPSAVDAEVYAAAVARQPVVFVVDAQGGSLPNAADKRHPVMDSEITAGHGWAPLAELLHHVSGDARSALVLYARALSSPWLGLATAPLRALLLLIAMVLLAAGIAHSLAASLDLAAIPALQRSQVLAVQAGVLTLGALPLLATALYLLLVLRRLARQLGAARRASLRAGEAAFRREDWVGLIPGLEPGEALYQALLASAPLAHHERQASPKPKPKPRRKAIRSTPAPDAK